MVFRLLKVNANREATFVKQTFSLVEANEWGFFADGVYQEDLTQPLTTPLYNLYLDQNGVERFCGTETDLARAEKWVAQGDNYYVSQQTVSDKVYEDKITKKYRLCEIHSRKLVTVGQTDNLHYARTWAEVSNGRVYTVNHNCKNVRVWDTGAKRDDDTGKPRFSEVSLKQLLKVSGGELSVTKGKSRQDAVKPIEYYEDRDLIPPLFLDALQEHLKRGAVKYGAYNWQKGIPLSSYFDSAMRHLLQWREGDMAENHLAAVAFNIMAAMWTEHAIKVTALPKELDDLDVCD